MTETIVQELVEIAETMYALGNSSEELKVKDELDDLFRAKLTMLEKVERGFQIPADVPKWATGLWCSSFGRPSPKRFPDIKEDWESTRDGTDMIDVADAMEGVKTEYVKFIRKGLRR